MLDPADADRLIAEGVCDAVGMTRAQIADPNLARRARAGEPVTRCIGCNQGCIGHYHAGVPIACTVNPWTGYERTLPPPAPADGPGPWSSSAPGRPAAPPPPPPPRAGTGWWCSSGRRTPAARCGSRSPRRGTPRSPRGCSRSWTAGSRRCDVRYGAEATAADVLAERPDRIVVATGADPHLPAIGGDGVAVVDAWAALAGAPVGERVVVSDWGGDWTGLDTAEALAARGAQVRLVTSAIAFGEGVHQYQRNLYLARLDDAGVELHHHLRPGRRAARGRRRSRTSSRGARSRSATSTRSW